MDTFNYLNIVLSCLLAIPTVVFAMQILAAAGKDDIPKQHVAKRAGVAILVPAHNEESIISSTLYSIVSQLNDDDVLLVVEVDADDTVFVLQLFLDY